MFRYNSQVGVGYMDTCSLGKSQARLHVLFPGHVTHQQDLDQCAKSLRKPWEWLFLSWFHSGTTRPRRCEGPARAHLGEGHKGELVHLQPRFLPRVMVKLALKDAGGRHCGDAHPCVQTDSSDSQALQSIFPGIQSSLVQCQDSQGRGQLTEGRAL